MGEVLRLIDNDSVIPGPHTNFYTSRIIASNYGI